MNVKTTNSFNAKIYTIWYFVHKTTERSQLITDRFNNGNQKFSNSICPSNTLHIRIFICFGFIAVFHCSYMKILAFFLFIGQNQYDNRFFGKGFFPKTFYWHEIIDLKLKTDHFKMTSIRLKNCVELIFSNICHALFRKTCPYQRKRLNLCNSIFQSPWANHFIQFQIISVNFGDKKINDSVFGGDD